MAVGDIKAIDKIASSRLGDQGLVPDLGLLYHFKIESSRGRSQSVGWIMNLILHMLVWKYTGDVQMKIIGNNLKNEFKAPGGYLG